jgi:hypothetical protein
MPFTSWTSVDWLDAFPPGRITGHVGETSVDAGGIGGAGYGYGVAAPVGWLANKVLGVCPLPGAEVIFIAVHRLGLTGQYHCNIMWATSL